MENKVSLNAVLFWTFHFTKEKSLCCNISSIHVTAFEIRNRNDTILFLFSNLQMSLVKTRLLNKSFSCKQNHRYRQQDPTV